MKYENLKKGAYQHDDAGQYNNRYRYTEKACFNKTVQPAPHISPVLP